MKILYEFHNNYGDAYLYRTSTVSERGIFRIVYKKKSVNSSGFFYKVECLRSEYKDALSMFNYFISELNPTKCMSITIMEKSL